MAEQTLSLSDLNRATLARQMLLQRADEPVPNAVRRLASVQAQHPGWPEMALCSRLASHERSHLAQALQRRQVVRAVLMRITLHIVHADDYWPLWTVALPLVQTQFRLWYREQPTDPPVMKRLAPAHRAALAALADGPRPKAELSDLMAAAQPSEAARDPRYLWRHFAATTPLVDVPPPGGEARYGRSWYALAEAWLRRPAPDPGDRARALTLLVERYLAAYGPATRADISWWAGRLRAAEIRQALEDLDQRVVELRDEAGRQLVDLADAPRPRGDGQAAPRFLARWDSALLGHEPKFRTRILPAELHSAVNRPNGDVLPTFLVDGLVAGTWRHEPGKKGRRPVVEMTPLRRLSAADRGQLLDEAARVAVFLEPEAKAEVRFSKR
jgi:hypothetical protein